MPCLLHCTVQTSIIIFVGDRKTIVRLSRIFICGSVRRICFSRLIACGFLFCFRYSVYGRTEGDDELSKNNSQYSDAWACCRCVHSKFPLCRVVFNRKRLKFDTKFKLMTRRCVPATMTFDVVEVLIVEITTHDAHQRDGQYVRLPVNKFNEIFETICERNYFSYRTFFLLKFTEWCAICAVPLYRSC